MRPGCLATPALGVPFALRSHPEKSEGLRHPGMGGAPVRGRDSLDCRRGWTLIELVLVIAILAILLAIALPSYQHYMLRVHRSEAIAALLEVAACQERIFAVSGRYDTTHCIPEGLDHYSIRMEPPGEAGSLAFIAWADPAGGQARDGCGSLGLDQTGLRKASGVDADVNLCWRGRRP